MGVQDQEDRRAPSAGSEGLEHPEEQASKERRAERLAGTAVRRGDPAHPAPDEKTARQEAEEEADERDNPPTPLYPAG